MELKVTDYASWKKEYCKRQDESGLVEIRITRFFFSDWLFVNGLTSKEGGPGKYRVIKDFFSEEAWKAGECETNVLITDDEKQDRLLDLGWNVAEGFNRLTEYFSKL